MAKMEMKEPALARELLTAAGKQLGSFNSQDIANTLWAMAAMEMKEAMKEPPKRALKGT